MPRNTDNELEAALAAAAREAEAGAAPKKKKQSTGDLGSGSSRSTQDLSGRPKPSQATNPGMSAAQIRGTPMTGTSDDMPRLRPAQARAETAALPSQDLARSTTSKPAAPAAARPKTDSLPPRASQDLPRPPASKPESLPPRPTGDLGKAPPTRPKVETAAPRAKLDTPARTGTGDFAQKTPAPKPKHETLPPRASPQKTPARRTDPPRGAARNNLELIDYSPDEPLIDHKGRSKPLYKPRSPRPASWRPTAPVRLLLGLVPGTRVMALDNFAVGLPYAILGLLTLVAAAYLLLSWSRAELSLATLMIAPRFILGHGAMILALAVFYELLRLASYLEEQRGLLTPRVLASLLLPASLVLGAAPSLAPLWPQLLESSFLAALVLAVGGLAGTVWCVAEGTLAEPRPRLVFRVAGGVILAGLLAAAVLSSSLDGHAWRQVAAAARSQGFVYLPSVLD